MPLDGTDPSEGEDLTVTSPSEWRKRAARALRTTPLKQLRGSWGQPQRGTGCALAVLSHAKLLPQTAKEGTSARNFEERFGISPDILMRLNDYELFTFEQIATFLETYNARSPSHRDHRLDLQLWEPLDPFEPTVHNWWDPAKL